MKEIETWPVQSFFPLSSLIFQLGSEPDNPLAISNALLWAASLSNISHHLLFSKEFLFIYACSLHMPCSQGPFQASYFSHHFVHLLRVHKLGWQGWLPQCHDALICDKEILSVVASALICQSLTFCCQQRIPKCISCISVSILAWITRQILLQGLIDFLRPKPKA